MEGLNIMCIIKYKRHVSLLRQLRYNYHILLTLFSPTAGAPIRTQMSGAPRLAMGLRHRGSSHAPLRPSEREAAQKIPGSCPRGLSGEAPRSSSSRRMAAPGLGLPRPPGSSRLRTTAAATGRKVGLPRATTSPGEREWRTTPKEARGQVASSSQGRGGNSRAGRKNMLVQIRTLRFSWSGT